MADQLEHPQDLCHAHQPVGRREKRRKRLSLKVMVRRLGTGLVGMCLT